ncbi:hypothetical protein IV102_23675 [bacterium]|nr:hypothetical protein [bacterium]
MSERQRLVLLCLTPVVRCLLLVFLILFVMAGADPSRFGLWVLIGNIGG